MMTVVRRLGIVLGLAVALSCSRDPVEEAVDGERLCEEHCEKWHSCGMVDDVQTCFEACMDHRGRGWNGPCRFSREAYLVCTTNLTCEELAIDQPPADVVPQDDRPCDEPRREYSLCTSEHDR